MIAKRLFRHLLQLDIDRQHQIVAMHRRRPLQ
jgi:hypothetical protein